MKDELSTVELSRLRAKYHKLPDLYWGDDPTAVISPARYEQMGSVVQCQSKSSTTNVWDLCAGSAALSAAARTRRAPHLPPVNHRYGWHLFRTADQVLLLHGLLST